MSERTWGFNSPLAHHRRSLTAGTAVPKARTLMVRVFCVLEVSRLDPSARCEHRRDEGGRPMVTTDEGRATEVARELRRLVDGYQVTQALHVFVALGLPDLLQEPLALEEAAERSGSRARPLLRLLRALAGVGVVARDDRGRWRTTPLGDGLASSAQVPVAGWAGLVGRPYYWQAWSGLLDSVRTGENAFVRQHGTSIWEWRAAHPHEQAVFDRAMTALSQAVLPAVLDVVDLSGVATVVDVGGGRGALLAGLLDHWPQLHGVLAERPEVVAAVQDDPYTPLGERGSAVACDFFVEVPAGADAYVLKAVVHDWADEPAVEVLRCVRRAVPPHGRVLLVEQLLDEGPDPVRTAFSDLNMLLAPGGCERTREEYAALLERAGLRLQRVLATRSTVFVLEAHPVP